MDKFYPDPPKIYNSGTVKTTEFTLGAQATVKDLSEYLLANFPHDALVDLTCNHETHWGAHMAIEISERLT